MTTSAKVLSWATLVQAVIAACAAAGVAATLVRFAAREEIRGTTGSLEARINKIEVEGSTVARETRAALTHMVDRQQELEIRTGKLETEANSIGRRLDEIKIGVDELRVLYMRHMEQTQQMRLDMEWDRPRSTNGKGNGKQ